MVQPRSEGLKRSKTRTAAHLNAKLNKGLLAYVGAASAAGVGMLAAAQPVEGEIVYTPANIPIVAAAGPVPVDLNNDGTVDFFLTNYYYVTHGIGAAFLKVTPAQAGNGIWVTRSHRQSHRHQVAVAGLWGVVVGGERQFQSSGLYMDFDGINAVSKTGNTSFGPWGKGKPLTGFYLALKFTFSGQVHYGWARVSVRATGTLITATLTGYAYETVANRGIITGFTRGTLDAAATNASVEAIPATEPSSLGILARGAAGMSALRRQQPVATGSPARGE
jgi:hypothetical protein